MRNVKRLGDQVSVPMHSDEDGYFGRECPVEECRGYFKVTPGTGVQGSPLCHCPYCGHSGDNGTFWTQEQIEYARSFVLRQVTDALHKDMKSMEFDHKTARWVRNRHQPQGDASRASSDPILPRERARDSCGLRELRTSLCNLRRLSYSFGNVLEIARQRPTATKFAGMYAWNQLGRRVKKGEKGIRILAIAMPIPPPMHRLATLNSFPLARKWEADTGHAQANGRFAVTVRASSLRCCSSELAGSRLHHLLEDLCKGAF